jgi:hypothetical protein
MTYINEETMKPAPPLTPNERTVGTRQTYTDETGILWEYRGATRSITYVRQEPQLHDEDGELMLDA